MKKDHITITVKLYSGLETEAFIQNYNQEEGIAIHVKRGTRIKKVIKTLNLNNPDKVAYFIDGKQYNGNKKCDKNCEIICVVPTAGG